jgi:protein-tyrosine phosphatase
MKILMVCLGNICRSPLAEGILRHKVQQKGLDWEVDSAGTSNWHQGEAPDARSIAIAQKYGIDISQLKARQFHKDDFKRFDRIYVMDSSNHQNVVKLAFSSEDRNKVDLLMNAVKANNQAVPDPYYGKEDDFELVYQMIDQACEAIIARLTEVKG